LDSKNYGLAGISECTVNRFTGFLCKSFLLDKPYPFLLERKGLGIEPRTFGFYASATTISIEGGYADFFLSRGAL